MDTRGFPEFESLLLTVIVIWLLVTVALGLNNVSPPVDPLRYATAAVTMAAGLNSNPEGAFKMIVPVLISLFAPSLIAGPVKEVYAPVPPTPAVSTEILLPPVAGVTEAFAETGTCGSTSNTSRKAAMNLNVILLDNDLYIFLLL
jgi:hypothetical protein